ncbi:polyadenylate-binding protein-interacting protein 3-like [Dioscorea cayenensis subsp. rotundata]|uniref:Polyadenylate-binding protein-interacting protein 3-like n=1 Tax=Dioscorea cayennensis subsp. rotundata TaxID=55577 RepID=A0AB40BFB4_DIOCR|nr:polyadenylate-binding protein-interacting protein 3-like [Dioscorea cayenensis subsp. rotundata]XP_039125281.1 polyadenylate-binding protein-interacting protein 3-like [Dioscorea cayenensis subsp. rotundata]
MNPQQCALPRSSTNGIGRRREMNLRVENKMHGKSASSSFGLANGDKGVSFASPSHDRLIFVMTCLIGQTVEVHLRNGSIISGIFYTSDTEKDFGIILKMARVIKDGSSKGQKPFPDIVKKPHTMIIPARELVQVLAKDVPLSVDAFANGNAHDKLQDLMIDSAISQSHHVEVGRELKPWTPDKDDPECPELDDIFDGTWNRNWNQFETNEALFGVKSTFDEELYTTKLERGPQMRQLEKEAIRIAREIQEEDTKDLHLAEERGIHFHGDHDLDEEIRFSAVRRDIDSRKFAESENAKLDTYNPNKTLKSAIGRSYSDIARRGIIDEARALSTCSSVDEETGSQIPADRVLNPSGSGDHLNDCIARNSQSMDDGRLDEVQASDQDKEKGSANRCAERISHEEAQTVSFNDGQSLSIVEDLSANAAASAPGQENEHSSSERLDSGKKSDASEPVNLSLQPAGSTSSTSEHPGAGLVSSRPGLSPSSSMGSLSSEKSTLNPHAKEFKLNPNAKSFTPSSSFRPQVPASEGSFYYANNVSAVPHLHSLPVGVGMGPSFVGPQPIVYNAQATQMQSQPFIHPNGPLYGQQMVLGQPRPVMYMPAYPPEMTYKGRNF